MLQDDFAGDSLSDLLSVGSRQAFGGEHYYSNLPHLNRGNSAISGDRQRWAEPIPLRAKSGYDQGHTTYVPVLKKKKKTGKICSIHKGMFIAGGSQAFGKFRSLKQCMRACVQSPTCFAGDYDPWLARCYFHGNITACDTLQTHSKLTHFKKLPCDNFGAQNFLLTLGAALNTGLLMKGIDNIKDCVKECLRAGSGPVSDNSLLFDSDEAQQGGQVCFGIDYDFGAHKCYFHVILYRRFPDESSDEELALCQEDDSEVLTPIDLTPNPSVVNIIICGNFADGR